jgi:hypothetical protein
MAVHAKPIFDDSDDTKPNGNSIQWVQLSHWSFQAFLTIYVPEMQKK